MSCFALNLFNLYDGRASQDYPPKPYHSLTYRKAKADG